MKAPILGLMVAAGAFAGSSLYLWVQLDDAHEKAAQVEQTTRQLNARIAELEKTRANFQQQRMAGPAIAGTFGSVARNAPPPAAASGLVTESAEKDAVWTATERPNMSPAFQKMMRNQIRAQTRRQYADVGEKLGLGKERTAKLIDLLAEYQGSLMTPTDGYDTAGVPRNYQEKLRQHEQEVSDLIGSDKVQALKEYEATLPARQEFENLARQLEDNGVPLSDSQKKRMVEVVIQEHDRTPMPQWVDGTDPLEYNKSVNNWKADFDKHVADEASHILDAEQMSAWNEIQQWQKDLRDQFSERMVVKLPDGNAQVKQGVAMGFVTASPAYVSGTAVNGVVVSSELHVEEPKKP